MTPRPLSRWIEAFSWGFVALGLTLPFAFDTVAFAPYREALALWAYGSAPVPAADDRLLGLMLGITGGSIAGKWIVHALLARGPLREGKAWARDVTLRGLAAWFLVDSIASLAIGAGFNVWMINLAPLALVGFPLLLAHHAFGDDRATTLPPASGVGDQVPGSKSTDDRIPSAPTAARACFYASLFGASTGLAIAFGGSTPLFATWFGSLEAAHYGGAELAEPSRRLALFFFGPIGGCTLAQFVMLAGMARYEPGAMRTAAAGAASITAWFVIDGGYGLANDGVFNIAMVNVPAVLVTLPPWLLLASRRSRRFDGKRVDESRGV